MNSETTGATWIATAFTRERPASANKPAGSQDAVAIDPLVDDQWWSMAVADGHGDAAHIRSRHGAEAACRSSRNAALTLQEAVAGGNRAEAQRFITDLAGRQIVRNWNEDVKSDALSRVPNDADLEATGLSTEEWRQSIHEGVGEDDGLVERLYGTTVIGCLVGPSFAGAWQIGDGLVVFVDVEGQVTFPLNVDDEPLGDVTQSLATKNASNLFRTQALWESTDRLLLIALLTDGIEKAYRRLEDLEADLKAISLACKEEEPAAAKQRLEKYAEEFAIQGSDTSGDDATIALLLRQFA